MTTLNAAAPLATPTRGPSLDFSKPTSSPSEPSGFASKLRDAQQDAKPDAAPVVNAAEPKAVEPKKAVEKSRKAKDVDESGETASKPRAAKAKIPEDERPVDQDDESDAVDDAEKVDAQAPANPKKSDDALLAALAASATPISQKPVTEVATAKPAADVNTPAAVAVTAAAASGVASPDVAGAVSDQPAASTDAKAKAVQASDAKPAGGDAKLDALTAKLKPVDDKNAPLPAEAAEHHGGDAKQHSSPQQQQQAPGDSNASIAQAPDPAASATTKSYASKDPSFDDLLSKLAVADAQPTRDATPTPAPSPTAEAPLRPEQQFAKDNVDKIVSSVQTQAGAAGNGTMNVRLNPPELGALDVAAKMLDGKMSVAFTTSNEQATQLLSHSLSHLKTSLESAGITVDRLEVRQGATPSTSASSDRESSGQQQPGGRGFESATQQQGEQSRKQMVEKLWRKYAYGSDEVDLVA